jgi:hypothetical protein
LLGRLVQSATTGGADYAADVKPWLAGPLFFGIRPATDGASVRRVARPRASPFATTDGKVTCDALFAKEKQTPTSVTYKSFKLSVTADGTFACALMAATACSAIPCRSRRHSTRTAPARVSTPPPTTRRP